MRINVDTKKIPYEFRLKSLDKIFILNFKHFISNDSIYIDLLSEDEYYLLENEKLIYGRPLGLYVQRDEQGNMNSDMPQAYIIPLSEDGKAKPVTLETLGNSVFLEYFETDTDGVIM